jgi:hypothetical protein
LTPDPARTASRLSSAIASFRRQVARQIEEHDHVLHDGAVPGRRNSSP